MSHTGSHDAVLVGISILIAVLTSFTALDLAGRIRESDHFARRVWLVTASLAMGGGIWAMHFVAMLAFDIPGVQSQYDAFVTFISLLVAMLATGVGFSVMSRSAPDEKAPLISAGIIMGLGVVSMHYMGMSAMQLPGVISYRVPWVVISIAIAIGASVAALWLSSRNTGSLKKVIAALIMGAAISGMHFAAMHAAVFTLSGDISPASISSGVTRSFIASAVALTTFGILSVALAAAIFDRRLGAIASREAASLRMNEERFRSLYNGTPLPLHSLDEEGRIEHVSDAWLALLGYRRDEVIGRPFADFLARNVSQSYLENGNAALLSEGSIIDHEYRLVRKDNEVIDVLLSARVERDSEGRFVQILGGLADITGRRHTEEALRQSQKMETIGHLTGGVAHDFNNLLAVVIGTLDMIRRRVDDPKIISLVENALEGANRGATLTQRLLAFARKQNLKPVSVSVPDLIHGLADLLSRSLGPLVEMRSDFPLSLPKVYVDDNQLEMAILNLAVNARDAMPDGGLLEISADEVFVEYGEDLAPGRYVRISLKDHGIGMDEETLKKATEPFFTSKGTGKGTGLGLSMVQGFAAQSGGTLQLKSVLGSGTCAELWLPSSQDLAMPVSDMIPIVRRPAPLAPKSFLVVDDDGLVLMNTVAMLEDDGHTVVSVYSGTDALRVVEEGGKFDLLITDYLMPGMNGVKLAEAARKINPDMPVLLVSGFAQLPDGEICEWPILPKPFNQVELAAAVSAALGKSGPMSLVR